MVHTMQLTRNALPPPEQLSNRVADEVYAKVGAANDLVLVRRSDGLLTVSDFHVSFNQACWCLLSAELVRVFLCGAPTWSLVCSYSTRIPFAKQSFFQCQPCLAHRSSHGDNFLWHRYGTVCLRA